MVKQLTDIKDLVVIDSDNNIFFDVDETLVFWKTDEDPNDVVIQAQDPYLGGKFIDLVPHTRTIDLLKRNFGQGRTIVVWSAGGYAWAESVVKALGLTQYVHLIMAKPVIYVDDKPMNTWTSNHVYLHKQLPPHPTSKSEI